MITKLLCLLKAKRVARLIAKVKTLRAIPHTSGYSKWEADRRIELLNQRIRGLCS